MPETEEERKAREAKEAQKNAFERFFENLNPFSGGFSIGGIFQALFAAILVYVAANTETVQKFIGQFLNDKDESGKVIEGSGAKKVKEFVDGITSWGTEHLVPDFVLDKMDATEMLQNPDPENVRVKTFLKTLPQELQDVLAKDGNLKTMTNLILNTNKDAQGKMSALQLKQSVTNDKTIFALLTQQPALAKEIVNSLKTGAPANGAASKTMAEVMASIKTIISDKTPINGKTRLATLLDATNRPTTISLLKSLMPADKAALATDEALNALLDAGIDKATGEPTEAFRNMLLSQTAAANNDQTNTDNSTPGQENTAAVGGNTETPASPPVQGQQELEAATNKIAADTAQQAATAAITANIKNPGDKQAFTNAIQRLRTKLGDATFVELALAMQNGSDADKQAIFLRSDIQPHIKELMYDERGKPLNLNALSDEYKKPLQQLMDLQKQPEKLKAVKALAENNIPPETLKAAFTFTDAAGKVVAPDITTFLARYMNNDFQQTIVAKAGSRNVATVMVAGIEKDTTIPKEMKQLLTVHNIQILQHFLHEATKTKDANGRYPSRQQIAIVTGALVECFANNNPEPLKNNTALIAQYFQKPEFSKAFLGLISRLKLSPEQNKMLAALKDNWGSVEKNDKFLKDKSHLNDHMSNGYGLAEILANAEALTEFQTRFIKKDQSWIGAAWQRMNIDSVTLDDNIDYIMAIGKILEKNKVKVPTASEKSQPSYISRKQAVQDLKDESLGMGGLF